MSAGSSLVADQLERHLPAEPSRALYVDPDLTPLLARLRDLGHQVTVGASGEGPYDIVCAHAAVLSLPHPRPLVVVLCDLMAPGGVVSLLGPAERLEELASYVAGRRMHVEAWYGVQAGDRREALTVHLVGRRDGVRSGA